MTTRRLRVGVVGCGLVAQIMHLHYLAELHERFEVMALCDLSPEALAFAGSLFPDAHRHEDWQNVLAEPPDVVMVLTPGSHEPVAVAAAEAGVHVFVEKPIAFSTAEAERMIDAAERAGVRLMVGYMKRYDPTYEALCAHHLPDAARLVRVTTLESPLEPYVAHYPLRRGALDPDVVAELVADDERRVGLAIGTDDPVLRRAYRSFLIDSMAHELNAVRGLLGEPDELRHAHVYGEPTGITAALAFGDVEAVFLWVDLPGIASYEQEIAVYSADARARLVFPSPFLRSAPTRLVLEGGERGSPDAWVTERVVAYDEAFRRELLELHACIVEEREPRTNGVDGLRDIALCQAIVLCHMEARPVPAPTEVERV